MGQIQKMAAGLVAGFILLISQGAAASTSLDQLTLGGEIRARYEFRENSDFASGLSDTLSFVGLRTRLDLGYEVTREISLFLQFQDSRLFGSEASVTSNEGNLDLHQGTLSVKNIGGPLTMLLGRQEMVFGDSRLVGNFGWSNVGRSFDAIRFSYARGMLRADLWAAVTKLFGDNIAPDPSFSPGNRDAQQFYGIYMAVESAAFSLEPYVLYLRDTGDAGETDSGALVSPVTAPLARGQDRVTLGVRTEGRVLDDSIDLTAEAVYQTGVMDARGTTPRSDIRAYAFAVKTGYTLPVAMRPRFGIEYDRASGDDDPTDDLFQTFENLFPTNHGLYGHMDYVGWRNMQDLSFSLGIHPTPESGVRLNIHLFWLAEEADHWYRASGAIFGTTPAGNTEKELGQELDLVGYMVLKERLRIEAGYGHFFPGEYVKTHVSAAGDHSDFVYVQTALRF